jgi:hypothetical protein
MLDDTLKAQLQQYLALLRQPIRLIASLDDSETGTDMKSLLETIVGLSDKVSLDTSGDDARKPSFVVAREGQTQGVRFAGLPLGHEFTSLVLALLWTGGHPPKVEADVIDRAADFLEEQSDGVDALVRRAIKREHADGAPFVRYQVNVLVDRTATEPSEELENRELRSYLRDAVKLLPERHRLVIVGYFLGINPLQLLGGDLGGIGRRLARTLEADAAGRRPADDGPGGVGDRNDGVVERRLDVGVTHCDVLLVFTTRLTSRGLWCSHFLVPSRGRG